MEDAAVRWNIRVSKKTALAVRDFLYSQGTKQGDLSKFIENAIHAHIFRCTVQDIKARNADADPEELQTLIDDAVREIRAERRAKHSLMRVVLDTNILVSALLLETIANCLRMYASSA